MKNRILRLVVEVKFPTNYDYKNLSEFVNKIRHPFISSELSVIDKFYRIDKTNQTFSEVSNVTKYPGTDNICKMLNDTIKEI